MTMNKMKINTNEKGFTLVELMIVIAIIGILAAIAVPNFISYRNRAYCSAMQSDAQTISSAIADYFANPSHTTVAATDLNVNTSNGNTFTLTTNGTSGQITITVTDGSGRCALTDGGSSTYTLSM